MPRVRVRSSRPSSRGAVAPARAAAGARINLLGRKSVIALPGGELLIEWRKADDHILMTGPFAYEFEGELPDRLLTVPA